MSLVPTLSERVARARTDLRLGLPVLLRAADSALLVAAAETVQHLRLQAMRSLGEVSVGITGWRAQTLKVRAYDGDIARIALPLDADAQWVQGLADPAKDLAAPMRGPFQEHRGGSAGLHRLAIDLVKSAQLLPAVVAVDVDIVATFQDLTALPADAAAEDLTKAQAFLPVAAARLPMTASEAGRLHIFRPGNGDAEHYAIEVGKPDRAKPVLARLHSACFTGDVLGSLKCDCGPQLRGALSAMGTEGAGVLIYLNQEGRGIGLANKMRAYGLQDQGFDTVEANHRLGFEDDERDFRLGADILKQMGFSTVRLMTNNPNKVSILESCGLEVKERVPLITGETSHNTDYLAIKREKSGHLL